MISLGKVTSTHLERNAYLYIRQSSLKQVVANKESGQRQYALTERALALGWSKERIVVIDDDTGQSGAEAHERKGFQRLVAEVGMAWPESSWVWRSLGWHEITPIGTACWRSVRWLVH